MDRYSEQEVVRKIVAMSVNLEKTFPKASEEMVKCAEKFINKDISFVDSYDTALSFVNDKQILASMVKDRDMMREAGIFDSVKNWFTDRGVADQKAGKGAVQNYRAKQKQKERDIHNKAAYSGVIEKMSQEVKTLLGQFSQEIDSEKLRVGIGGIISKYQRIFETKIPKNSRLYQKVNQYLQLAKTVQTSADTEVNNAFNTLSTHIQNWSKQLDVVAKEAESTATPAATPAAAPVPAAGTPTTTPTGAKAGTGVKKKKQAPAPAAGTPTTTSGASSEADPTKSEEFRQLINFSMNNRTMTIGDFKKKNGELYNRLPDSIKEYFEKAMSQSGDNFALDQLVSNIMFLYFDKQISATKNKSKDAPVTAPVVDDTGYSDEPENRGAFSKKDLVVLSQVLDDSGFHREAESVLNFIK